ncbi:MAG: hypothetical protein JWN34_5537 [Bryobacterales bacterium]|nr:hypothetical protein [Bryobacterales bacterium]
MTKNFLFTKIGLVAAVVPILLYAYSEGPDQRHTGAPGELTCLECHTSGFPLNGGPGSLRIVLPGNATYTPGVKQTIKVQVTDATKSKFGFQLSARLAGDVRSGQAGDLNSIDALTQTLCDDGTPKSSDKCSRFPVQFIEHTSDGYRASTAGGYTYQFDWTPPATDVGNVTFYAAGVAGPPGGPIQTNANVYTTNITLTPAAVGPSGPTISSGGVVPVYSSSTTIQPGSWFSVYGTNLAASTAVWNGDFPTSLGGTSVSVNGKPAYLWFVSAGQINAQAPDDTATGSVPFTVTSGGVTASSTVTLAPAGPSFLLLADGKHATGIIITPNGSGSQGGGSYDLLGPASLGAGFRPAKKGEAVAIYAVGLGPTSPAVPSGQIFSGAARMVNAPVVTLGSAPVAVDFAGIVGAGLYQINFVVPQNAGSGEQSLQALTGGVSTQANITIPIE